MLRTLKLMTAALIPAAVLACNAALADDIYTVTITNNTVYDFIDGVYDNKSGVNVQTPIPTTIPMEESGTVQFKYNVNITSSPHLNMHWTLENSDGDEVAAIIKNPGNCHTDVPDGVHSDHYNCNSKNISFVYCMSEQTENCHKQ